MGSPELIPIETEIEIGDRDQFHRPGSSHGLYPGGFGRQVFAGDGDNGFRTRPEKQGQQKKDNRGITTFHIPECKTSENGSIVASCEITAVFSFF
jgi:hypothetical protein